MNHRKELISKHGSYVSANGNLITRLGNEKGCDMSNAQAAASRKTTDKSSAWWNKNIDVRWVRTQLTKGRDMPTIIRDFNELLTTKKLRLTHR